MSEKAKSNRQRRLDKQAKAHPTEVGIIDLLIEVRGLRGDVFLLRKRIEALESRPDVARIGGAK